MALTPQQNAAIFTVDTGGSKVLLTQLIAECPEFSQNEMEAAIVVESLILNGCLSQESGHLKVTEKGWKLWRFQA